MGLPIATTAAGICFAFPDVVGTLVGTTSVPVPYPNIAQLSQATGTSTRVNVGGSAIILQSSEIKQSTGDEAGSAGPIKGPTSFTSGSSKVHVNGKPVVRMTDPTSQNGGNATGTVLGGDPRVLCG